MTNFFGNKNKAKQACLNWERICEVLKIPVSSIENLKAYSWERTNFLNYWAKYDVINLEEVA